ncbi:MAG: DUF4215 domain-containing protein [Myxococcaceae bacterium]|nr:DUF4215 domain-containing protein [Myxococcaceae bacterium]
MKHALRNAFPVGFALTLALACNDGRIQKKKDPPPIPEPVCGDGRVDADAGEQCDGSDLGGNSCTSLGFDLGTVSCDAQCRLVTSQCVKLCGDGKIGPGEECDGTLGPLACPGWGYKACSASCKVDAIHCRSESFAVGTPISFSSGGVSILTDLAPEGPGDLVTAVPEFFRLQTHAWDPTKGFEANRVMSRMNDAERPALPIAGDLDGDGHVDLAAIHMSGQVARFRFVPAGSSNPTDRFQVEPLPLPADGGTPCVVDRWIGVGALDSAPGADLAALGCPTTSAPEDDAIFVFRGGDQPSEPTRIDAPLTTAATLADDDGDGLLDLIVVDDAHQVSIRRAPDFGPGTQAALGMGDPVTALAAGDLDGDGDADLVTVTATELTIFENTGGAFAERRSETAAAFFPLVRDLDLDGLLDLAWVEDGRVQVRRNLGGFTFAPLEFATGPGTPIGLSAGDVEGDDDPDLAASVLTASPKSVTYVFINPVR